MSKHQAVQADSYRWIMLLLYVLMGLALWICWFAQAPLLHEYWGKVYHIDQAKGNLLLSLPGLVAIFFGVITGRWVDTFGVRKMQGLSGILGVIGFGLRPFFVTSFAAQAVLTVIAGYGICILAATLAPTMIQWFGHEKAHTYIGIGAGGYFIGAGLGILVTASLLGPMGVKGTLTIWSIVMLGVTILWWLFARDNSAFVSSRERVAFSAEFKNVMQGGSSWLVAVYGLLLSGVGVFIMGFLPMQMIVVRHLPAAMAGAVVGIFAIATGVGLAVLPSLASRWGKKTTTVVLSVVTLILWIFYIAVPAWSIASLFGFAIVFGFVFQAPWATALALLESMPGVTARNVGVAAGVWTMAVNIGVFCLPILIGAIADQFKIPGGMWSILITCFLCLLAAATVKEKPQVQ